MSHLFTKREIAAYVLSGSAQLDMGPFKVWGAPRSKAARPTSAIEIKRIVRRTPGGHYWVESTAGLIRKPASAIPPELLAAFDERD